MFFPLSKSDQAAHLSVPQLRIKGIINSVNETYWQLGKI